MISTDRPEDNARFAAHEAADFPILSDSARTTATAYGVLGLIGFPQRWTFYIGPDGRILSIDKSVHVSTAGRDMAAKLKELGVPLQA